MMEQLMKGFCGIPISEIVAYTRIAAFDIQNDTERVECNVARCKATILFKRVAGGPVVYTPEGGCIRNKSIINTGK